VNFVIKIRDRISRTKANTKAVLAKTFSDPIAMNCVYSWLYIGLCSGRTVSGGGWGGGVRGVKWRGGEEEGWGREMGDGWRGGQGSGASRESGVRF